MEFFKIDGVGLLDDTTVPGNWASDTLIANNNSWTVTIPSDIAPGNYVLRHEIIALHSAGNADGAQNYPQCVNLEITGSGTATPSGTLGTALYTSTDPGILINIYQTLTEYIVPGPALYSDAAVDTPTASSSVAVSSTSSVGPTSAVITSDISTPVTSTDPASITTLSTNAGKSQFFISWALHRVMDVAIVNSHPISYVEGGTPLSPVLINRSMTKYDV